MLVLSLLISRLKAPDRSKTSESKGQVVSAL